MSWLNPKSVPRTINGESKNFFVVRPAVLERAEPLFTELAASFAAAFHDDTSTQASKQETIRRGVRPDGGCSEETTRFESPELTVGLRDAQIKGKQGAWSNVIRGFFSERARNLLCVVIVSSLRDDFPETSKRGNPREEDVEVLLDNLDADTLVECMRGVWEANKKLWESFKKALPKKVAVKLDQAVKGEPDQKNPSEGDLSD